MYPVSKAFLQAVQENTRHYYWTGRITTAVGAVYDFSQDDIVKGSGYISGQCCGSSEIELGTVYAAEMGISLYLPVDRYTLEDARSASENQRWRVRRNFEQGLPWRVDMFGYRLVDNRLEIVPEEAALLRRAAELYLEGHTQEMLADYFDKAGAVGRHGAKISGTGIIQLLCNEKIAGDMLLQKTHCIDPISKIHKVNHGEWTQYFVEGSHEGILDRETYKKVLAERARRVEVLGMDGRDCTRKHRPFSSRITCGECGKHFMQRVWDTKKRGRRAVWVCKTHIRSAASCSIGQIPEPLLEKLAAEAMGRRKFDPEEFREKVTEIRVPENGRLIFVFKDGHTVEKQHGFEWPDGRR